MITLIIAEVGRLFNVVGQAAEVIQHALHSSCFRRQHQAEACRHHFRRRLETQASAL